MRRPTLPAARAPSPGVGGWRRTVRTGTHRAAVFRILRTGPAGAFGAATALFERLVGAIPGAAAQRPVADAPGIAAAADLRFGGRQRNDDSGSQQHQAGKS